MTTLDIARLTTKQRLDLIGELWDSLASEDVLLTAAQEAELARRMDTFETDRKSAVAYTEVIADLDNRRK